MSNDVAEQILQTRRWQMSAASAAGASHVKKGNGSDDAHGYYIASDGTSVVAVVADGAGSRSPSSAIGSFSVCESVLSAAGRLIDSAKSGQAEAVYSVFKSALADINLRAERLGLEVDDLATTLAVAVVTPTTSLFAQIGDGIIVCDLDGAAVALIPEEKAGYVNETTFVTSPGALPSGFRFRRVDSEIRRFVLSTDGFRYKILRLEEDGAPFEPFFENIWDRLERDLLPVQAFNAWLESVDDQTGDDKTLVVGVSVPERVGFCASPEIVSSPEPPLPPARLRTELLISDRAPKI